MTQTREQVEAREFLAEQDAKRAERPLTDDEAFRKRIEDMYPWLKQWELGELE